MSVKTKFIGLLTVAAMSKSVALFGQNQNVQDAKKDSVYVAYTPQQVSPLDGADVYYYGVAKNIVGLEEATLVKAFEDENTGRVFTSNNGVVIFLPGYGIIGAVVKNGKLEYISSDDAKKPMAVDSEYKGMIEYINKKIVKYLVKGTDIYNVIVAGQSVEARKADTLGDRKSVV